jgi:hypothetical protein
MDFSDFEHRMQELAKDFSDYTRQRESLFQQIWSGRSDASSIVTAGTKTDEQLKDEYDKLHVRLGELCAAYLAMKERERARQLVGAYPDLLRQLTNHLGWSTRKVQTQNDQHYLDARARRNITRGSPSRRSRLAEGNGGGVPPLLSRGRLYVRSSCKNC